LLLATKKIGLPEIRQSLMSWLGHARQANTRLLRRELLPRDWRCFITRQFPAIQAFDKARAGIAASESFFRWLWQL
jgi:hypothetical protein